MPAGPTPILVVASWYPSAIDPVAGRFVADQAAALAARGTVAPAVVSFDPADLIGSGAVRGRVAAAIAAHVRAAVLAPEPVFAPGPGGLPVARLAVPSGRYREGGSVHALVARRPGIRALADRWLQGTETAVPRPTLVHAHTAYPDGAAAAELAARLGCPLIITEHASAVERLVAAPEVRAAYLNAAARAHRLLVVSRTLAAELARLLPELEPKLEVIPNGVDLAAFRAAPFEARRPDELLFVGYRKATKGISTLLRAVAIVRTTRPGVTLRLVGGSPTTAIEDGWRREAIELGIDDAVSFEGPAGRAEVAAAMARASLFVHPSPRETFGVVAIEALASGLPVVAVDSGGVTEILAEAPDELGAVVPDAGPEALAAAVAAALDRRPSFDPARLRASVEARFAADTVAGRVEAVYRSALMGSGGEAGTSPAPATSPSIRRAPGPAGPIRIVVALDPDRAAEVARVVARSGAGRAISLVTGFDAPIPDGVFAATSRLPAGIRISGLRDAAVLRSGAGGLGRWLQLLRHPIALARRRGWLGGPEAAATTAGDAAVRAAVAGVRTTGPETGAAVELVCCDGIDHLAVVAVIRDGLARPAPGGIRWLGDALGVAGADGELR